jgi:uncharacterized protein (DUF427 family)
MVLFSYGGTIMKATWENTLLAESDNTIVVEGNHYFPPGSVKKEYFRASEKHSTCPWKGIASYYHVNRRKGESRCCLVLLGTEGGG